MGFDLVKTRKLMAEKGLECIIATSHDNVYYCSGSDIGTITSLKRLAAVFIFLEGDTVFGVHANEEITARETTWIKDVRVYKGGEWEPLKPLRFVVDVLKEKIVDKSMIGLEMLDVPSLYIDYLRDLLPSAKLVDCKPIFDELRAVKSSDELRLLSDANMATAKAITVSFEMARVGDTERDIARNMMDLTIKYGADKIAFINLGAGKNVFELHHKPVDYKIKKYDLVHVDFGAYFRGYMSDISRMAVVDSFNVKQRKAYDFVVQVERVTGEAMREATTIMDVHNTVKKFYESNNYSYNKAFIGHSIGISCHEYPFLGPSHGDWILKKGMFFQVEPSLTLHNIRVHTEDSFIINTGAAKNVSEYRDVSELQIIR